ncbi:MAG TPA: ATP-binding protein [Chloroflexota bacterium]
MEQSAGPGDLADRLKTSVLETAPVLGLLAIFVADVTQPVDVVFSILYTVPILATIFLNRARATYLLFALGSIATVAAAALGRRPADPPAALTNHALALVAQMLAAVVVIQQLQLRDRQQARAVEKEAHLAHARDAATHARARLLALGSLIQAIPEGVVMLDARGVVSEINGVALELLRLHRPAVLGRPWREIARGLTMAGPDPVSTLLAGAWPGDGPATVQAEVEVAGTAEPPVRCVISGAALRDATGLSGGVVLVHNITDLRRQEREKAEFVSMATHELRSPLTTLRGYAQLAARSASRANEPEMAATASKILRQADKLNGLVADLMDLSRIQSGRMLLRSADLDMAELITDAAEQQRAAHPGRDIMVEVAGHPPMLRADDQRIGQVVANLLDNAIKYSPEGGEVRIRLWYEPHQVCVSVTDHGIGIPLDEQGQVFHRFSRGKSAGRRFDGLGVGLFISDSIVRDHGGHMWLESVPDQGSTFGFALPIVPLPPAA